MVETWVLFLIIITGPGKYEVHPLNTYDGVKAQQECSTKTEEIMKDLKTVYTHKAENDTYQAICLKQLEITT